MNSLNISEVVQLTGISSATLRFYEKKGLIAPIGRDGLKRLYKPEVLTRLALILLAKQNHFSLDEISILLDNMDTGLDRHFIGSKIEEIEQHIVHLQQIKEGLLHITHCKAENHFLCPNFQNILNNVLAQNQHITKKDPNP